MRTERKQTAIYFIFAFILGSMLGLFFSPLSILAILCLFGVCLVVAWKHSSAAMRWNMSVVMLLILFGFGRVQLSQMQTVRETRDLAEHTSNNEVLFGRVMAVRPTSIEVRLRHSSLRLRGYFRGRVEPFSLVKFKISPKKLACPRWSDPVKVTFVAVKVIRRSPFVWIFALRDQWTQVILDQMRPPLGAWFRLLLLGDEGMPMAPALQTTFKYLGIMHLMVVSGAQMGILTQLILLITQRWALPFFIEGSLLVLVQGLFAIMVGGGVSVWRSMLMSIIAYGAFRSRRRLQGMMVLELTVLILLMLCPQWMVSLGFWLSVLATAGLMELAPFLEPYISRWLAMMMGPLLLTAPVILLTFHRLDILSLFANLLIVPLVEWIVVTGFAALGVITIAPVLAPYVLGFEEGLMVWVYQLVHFFKQISGMTMYLPFTPWPLIIGWFGAIFFLLRLMPMVIRYWRVGVGIGVVLVCFQVIQVAAQPSTWCFMAKRQGAWVVIANKDHLRVVVMNPKGEPLYQSMLGRYPFLESPHVIVVKDRWLLSHRQHIVSVGSLKLLTVGDKQLKFNSYWQGLIFDVQHWPASKGLVFVWKGHHIRRLNAREYFS